MNKQEIIELDKNLDIFIGRTIYCIKNKIYENINYQKIDTFLVEKHFEFGKLPLRNLHDYVYLQNENCDKDKLMVMFVDFKITFVEVSNTYYKFVITNNKIIELNSTDISVLKIEAHDIFVTFVLKYRSLWDKIMGILVLVYFDKNKYEIFCKSRSRKNHFKKLFVNHLVWNKIELYYSSLDDFDNQYRTPEAHYDGRARKETIFNTGKYLDNEYHKTIVDKYFNPMMDFVNVFGQLLNYAKFNNDYYLNNIIV